MEAATIYSKSSTKNVNIKDYKFRRLNRDTAFWTAWKTGKLEDKSNTKVLYKLTSAMKWARFTKPEIFHMLQSWRRKHRIRCKNSQLEAVYTAVENWITPKIRERKRLEMQRYRKRQRQKKALEAFRVQIMGGAK